MPLRNRVDPFGDIFATDARGEFMGNRGCLHDENKQLRGRPWRHKNWIICELQFKGRRQEIMKPGNYTQLFFLDEATALAAGHRPCAECRRERYRAFVSCLTAAEPSAAGLPAKALDERLHGERLTERSEKRRWQGRSRDLPNGVFVVVQDQPWVVRQRGAHRWTPSGYSEQRMELPDIVEVLTPPTIVAALRGGYVPRLHASLERLAA